MTLWYKPVVWNKARPSRPLKRPPEAVSVQEQEYSMMKNWPFPDYRYAA